MRHPFNLDLETLKTLDLDFEEQLTFDEADQVDGALRYATTKRMGEEGGWCPPSMPIEPPIMTTMALGEEGGWCPPGMPTKLRGETGGWCPPEVTTLALGEEGGDWM